MRSKAPLALIELIIMILIFSLAAALCLQAFMWASQQSEDLAVRDKAVLAVQNTAETLKTSKGDISKAEIEAAAMTAENPDFTVIIDSQDVNMQGLGSAKIKAMSSDGEPIFDVEVFWQKTPEGGAVGE